VSASFLLLRVLEQPDANINDILDVVSQLENAEVLFLTLSAAHRIAAHMFIVTSPTFIKFRSGADHHMD
jgi:hypothetical protein